MAIETVRLVQFAPVLGPPDDGTLDRICETVRRTDADLVVFTELTTTGYHIFDRLPAYAEPIGGETTTRIGRAAVSADTHVLFGMAVANGDEIYNSAVWIDRDGAVRGRYDKRQLWGEEKTVFTPGTDLLVVEGSRHTFGIQICYDLNFPEQSASFAKAAIDVLINISAWSVSMSSDWDRLLSARALENGAYVLACNRVGDEHQTTFHGHSAVYNPDGTIAARLKSDAGTLSRRLSDELLDRERNRNPMRRDRRERSAEITRISIERD